MPQLNNEQLLLQEKLNLLLSLQLHGFIKQENIKKETDRKVIEAFRSAEELRKAQITELNNWLEKIAQYGQDTLKQNQFEQFILNFKKTFNLNENLFPVEGHLSSSLSQLQAAFSAWQNELDALKIKRDQTTKLVKDTGERQAKFIAIPLIALLLMIAIIFIPEVPIALVLGLAAFSIISAVVTATNALYKESIYLDYVKGEYPEYQTGLINAKTNYERKRDNIFSALNRPENSMPSAGAVVEQAPSNIRVYPNLFVTSKQQSNDSKSANNSAHSGPTL